MSECVRARAIVRACVRPCGMGVSVYVLEKMGKEEAIQGGKNTHKKDRQTDKRPTEREHSLDQLTFNLPIPPLSGASYCSI